MATVARLLLDIEANTANLQRSVDQTAGVMTRLENTAKTVGTALAAAFSVSAIANMAKEVTDTAGAVQDAADKIGISAEAVQKLGFAAAQGGSSIDGVGRAIKTMADQLASPSTGAVAAMDALGLNIDKLRGMTPDQAFLSMADAIKQVPDPLLQSAYATDLLGKSGVELLPAIKAGFTEIAETAPVMSDATVKAADDMGDAWAKTQQQIDVLKAQALTPLLETFMEMPASVQVGVGALAQFAPVLGNVGMAVMASGGPIAAFGMLTKALSSLSMLLTLPAGAVVAAIIGLVLVFQHWDEISAIAQRVYVAVKTWLLDKFTAVVDSIKQKVGAVTGFFRDMYEAVVGHSYVPDMITQIGTWFGKLGGLMVAPAAAAAQQTAGVFASLKNAAMGSLGDLNRIFQSAFEGGGGVAGAVKSMATNVVAALTSMIPVVGPFISQFSGAIVAGLAKIGPAIGNMMRELWTFGFAGGPDAAEREGNNIAEQFRESLAAVLTEAQKLEVQTAVMGGANRAWAESTIAIRDAYLAAGRSEAEALAVADRLWRAQQQGGDAVRKVIEEINAVINAGLTPAVTGFGVAMTDATTGAQTGLYALGDAVEGVATAIGAVGEDVLWPEPWSHWGDMPSFDFPDGGGGSGITGTGDEAADYADFIARNPGDGDRFDEAYPEYGTMHRGGIVDFAKWKRAHTGMLAYDEVPTILQAGEGVIRKDSMSLVGGAAGLEALNRGRAGGGTDTSVMEAQLGQLNSEIAAMRREQRNLPSAIKIAQQDAAALAPRRRAS